MRFRGSRIQNSDEGIKFPWGWSGSGCGARPGILAGLPRARKPLRPPFDDSRFTERTAGAVKASTRARVLERTRRSRYDWRRCPASRRAGRLPPRQRIHPNFGRRTRLPPKRESCGGTQGRVQGDCRRPETAWSVRRRVMRKLLLAFALAGCGNAPDPADQDIVVKDETVARLSHQLAQQENSEDAHRAFRLLVQAGQGVDGQGLFQFSCRDSSQVRDAFRPEEYKAIAESCGGEDALGRLPR